MFLLRPAGRAALLCSLVLGPLVAVESSAQARAADTAITLTGNLALAMFDDDVTAPDGLGASGAPSRVKYTAKLTETGTGALAGETVTLQRQLPSEPDYSNLDTGVTDDKGKVVFTTYAVSNADYRAVYAGTLDGPNPSVSQPVHLDVMRDLNAQKWTKPKKRKVGMLGDVNPGWQGKKVRWQKRTCATCTWKTIDHANASDTGAWRFAGGYPRKVGQDWYFRAILAAQGDYVVSYSGRLHTFVTPARSVARVAH